MVNDIWESVFALWVYFTIFSFYNKMVKSFTYFFNPSLYKNNIEIYSER